MTMRLVTRYHKCKMADSEIGCTCVSFDDVR
jgi:hypothetical protein